MKTVILCGGQGMRLREETEFRPKPLVTIGGRPLLWHIIKIYAHYGINDFVICLGYKGEMIKKYFLDYDAMNEDFTIRLGDNRHIEPHGKHEQNYSVTLAETGSETMTGGRISRIRRYIDDDLFMVTYGDGLADINIAKLLEFHRCHGKLATLTTVKPVSRFGVLEIGNSSEVMRFVEKPKLEGWISAGFLVFHREVFEYLGGDDCVLEQGPLEKLAEAGQLMAFPHTGFFFAVDTYREYRLLNELWDQGNAPWKAWAG
jgi:glucose-1-phosphate cytidylyltransferase